MGIERKKSALLGKSELKRLIAERLRDRRTKNSEFIKLTEVLIDLKGARPLVEDEPATSPSKKQVAPDMDVPGSDINELVRKLELDAKAASNTKP